MSTQLPDLPDGAGIALDGDRELTIHHPEQGVVVDLYDRRQPYDTGPLTDRYPFRVTVSVGQEAVHQSVHETIHEAEQTAHEKVHKFTG